MFENIVLTSSRINFKHYQKTIYNFSKFSVQFFRNPISCIAKTLFFEIFIHKKEGGNFLKIYPEYFFNFQFSSDSFLWKSYRYYFQSIIKNLHVCLLVLPGLNYFLRKYFIFGNYKENVKISFQDFFRIFLRHFFKDSQITLWQLP